MSDIEILYERGEECLARGDAESMLILARLCFYAGDFAEAARWGQAARAAGREDAAGLFRLLSS